MVEEPAPSDDSSSYSMTLSEFEEDRWYNPTPLSDDAAEIENVQRLIKYIRVRHERRIIARLYYNMLYDNIVKYRNALHSNFNCYLRSVRKQQ